MFYTPLTPLLPTGQAGKGGINHIYPTRKDNGRTAPLEGGQRGGIFSPLRGIEGVFFPLILALALLLPVSSASAALPSLLSDLSTGCLSGGSCTLCDFVQVFVNVARIILGLTGAIALFFFIYAGFTLITAQGKSETVEKGKQILVHTVIGIFIILAAWQAVRITVVIVTGGGSDKAAKAVMRVFTDPTYTPCSAARK